MPYSREEGKPTRTENTYVILTRPATREIYPRVMSHSAPAPAPIPLPSCQKNNHFWLFPC